MSTTLSMPLIGLAPAPRARARASHPATAAGLTALLATLGIACVVSLSGLGDTRAARALVEVFAGPDPMALVTATIPPSTYDPIDGRSRVVNWRSSLEVFAEQDRAHPPAPGGTVFVGSSSIRVWATLESDFPATRIVKRGFGGSRLSDTARYADRLILPYKPRQVVVYAGDNDLLEGATPEEVLASYASLVQQVHAALPATRVAFIAIKPSPSRAAQWDAVERANHLVAAYSRSSPQLDYIDVHTPMLGSDGKPRAELFQSDMLHLNRAGYALWRDSISSYLR